MNPWTESQLANDIHCGDREEARRICQENDLYSPMACGRCEGRAFYKHTIGTHKCPNCGSLRIGKNWK